MEDAMETPTSVSMGMAQPTKGNRRSQFEERTITARHEKAAQELCDADSGSWQGKAAWIASNVKTP